MRSRALFSIAARPAALAVLVWAIYAWSLDGPFLYDDPYYVENNPVIRSLGRALATFGDPQAVASELYSEQVFRPLLPVWYALIHAVVGLQPPAFHLVNILIHLLNTWLCFFLFRRLGGRDDAAAWGAALWAAHPAQVEAVASIAGLDDILGLTFVLAAVLCRQRGKTAAGVFFLALGVLTKETAVIGLPLLFAVSWLTKTDAPGSRLRKAIFTTWPYALPAIGYLVYRSLAIGLTQTQDFWAAENAQKLPTMLHVYLDYWRVILLPIKLRIFYLFDPTAGWNLPALGGAVALAATLWVMILATWRNRPGALGWWWFVLFLLPVSNLLPMQTFMNERFLYYPTVGLALLPVLGTFPAERRGKAIRCLFGVVLVVFAALSIHRVQVWREAEIFYEDIATKEPELIKYRLFLGEVYLEHDKPEKAVATFQAILKARPTSEKAAGRLAFALVQAGHVERAEALLKERLAVRPGSETAAANLAEFYYSAGDKPSALGLYQQLHAARPENTFYAARLKDSASPD